MRLPQSINHHIPIHEHGDRGPLIDIDRRRDRDLVGDDRANRVLKVAANIAQNGAGGFIVGTLRRHGWCRPDHRNQCHPAEALGELGVDETGEA